MIPLTRAPQRLCILRLSAIGDCCHVVPVIRTLQQAWPSTQLTWIIGRVEARLMSLLPGVEFITVDKNHPVQGARKLATQMRGRHFDILLHMQYSFRASLLSMFVPATTRIGFDRARARELQWLFTNERIPARTNEHVLESLQGFIDALGLPRQPLQWNLPLPDAATLYAQTLIPDSRPTLLISPCSSRPVRNWRAERYAEIADYAASAHGMRVILCGGPSALEMRMGRQIEATVSNPLINQIGRDTLPQMLALIARATALITPDSGPAHMGTMVGTPVIGLHAVTRSRRSGPYLSLDRCVDHFDEAAAQFRHCPGDSIPWSKNLELPGVMDLVPVAEVKARLDALLAASVSMRA